jgi:ADP-heptose:LPS heptosyltransferase
MYRYELPKQEVYFCLESGIGDCIAALPTILFVLNNHPQVYITLWVPTFFKTIARKSLPQSERLMVRDYSEKEHIKEGVPVKKFSGIPYTNLSRHMTIHAFDILVNTQPEDHNDYNYLPIDTKGVYLKRFNLPEKYIIICTGYTAKVREFKPEVVNPIIDYVIEKGYTPVFLGKEVTKEDSGAELFIKGNFNDTISFHKGINLINQTDMLEMVKIIKGAKCIVGLDNGLLHIAATTEIPIVAGFSSVKSYHRSPFRRGIAGWNFYPVELYTSELICTHCQSNMVYTYKQDFRECFYGDYKCLSMLTADRYIRKMEKII